MQEVPPPDAQQRRDGAVASALPRFLWLYGAMFAAFGVASPFLPGLLVQKGLSPTALGDLLAAGTAVRLLAGFVFEVVSTAAGVGVPGAWIARHADLAPIAAAMACCAGLLEVLAA